MTNKRSFAAAAALLILSPLGGSLIVYAAVDMKTANYTETWLDLSLPGTGYELRVQRTYNSRVIHNGIFGFGWCSDFETRLEVTAEGNIKISECGAGAEVLYTPKSFASSQVDTVISSILNEVKKRNPSMPAKGLQEIERDLRADDFFRESFAKRLGLKGSISQDVTYYANGRERETVQRQTQGFKRSLADSTYQMFDQLGRLTHMYDRSGNFLKLSYDKNRLTGITDNNGRRLTLTYNRLTGKVERVSGPNGLKASYKSDGDNLTSATNSQGQTFSYAYDDVHNMTLITLPTGMTKELKYNKDKDWVISFRNERGCVEDYEYKIDPKDSRGHFWSYVTKVCDGRVTNKSVHEFFHDMRKDGTGLYLKRVKSDVNGVVSDVVYHEIFGKPVTVKQGDFQVDYEFYDNGLIRKKTDPSRRIVFGYENACGKANRIETEFLERSPASKDKPSADAKVLKKLTTELAYDSRTCLLSRAENSNGQKISLTYDVRGRVSKIEDQSKKVLTIKYDTKYGRPQILSRPGMGTVKLVYKSSGDLDRAENAGGSGDPRVASQILSVFSNLLEVMSPAGSEVNI